MRERYDGWIPITDSEPEPYKAVDVTYEICTGKNTGRRFVEVMWRSPSGEWKSDLDEFRVDDPDITYLAWKPRPEPYRG